MIATVALMPAGSSRKWRYDMDRVMPSGVTRRLVVVGEGNDRGADAEDHRRVDLAMRVPVHPVVGPQVVEVHRDHHRLLLLGVDVLDQAVGDALGPVKARILLIAQLGDMLFPDDQPLILHDEDGPATPPSIGEEPELARLGPEGG
eukprot:scaffold15837_cov99-Isochrysis_galbana.AAC.4